MRRPPIRRSSGLALPACAGSRSDAPTANVPVKPVYRTVAALTVTLAALLSANVAAAAVGNDPEVTSNWAGYAVTGDSTSLSFTGVSSIWKEPTATCARGEATSSAFWVGLGGLSASSPTLDQIGTSADCTATGRQSYFMWYELVPAASVPIALKVFPGNVIAASVAVTGTKVTLQIRNLTRKTRFSKAFRVDALDVSSAEWVAEAPPACDQRGRCTVLPLTDFGTVPFANASATANGHTGSIVDDAWSATPIELASSAGRFGTSTAPSALSADGTACSVTFRTA
jgi:Peptidase A4 family